MVVADEEEGEVRRAAGYAGRAEVPDERAAALAVLSRAVPLVAERRLVARTRFGPEIAKRSRRSDSTSTSCMAWDRARNALAFSMQCSARRGIPMRWR